MSLKSTPKDNSRPDRGADCSKESIIINQDAVFIDDVTRLINTYYPIATGFLETSTDTWSVHEDCDKSKIRTVYLNSEISFTLCRARIVQSYRGQIPSFWFTTLVRRCFTHCLVLVFGWLYFCEQFHWRVEWKPLCAWERYVQLKHALNIVISNLRSSLTAH